jgi:hypothetical protein
MGAHCSPAWLGSARECKTIAEGGAEAEAGVAGAGGDS